MSVLLAVCVDPCPQCCGTPRRGYKRSCFGNQTYGRQYSPLSNYRVLIKSCAERKPSLRGRGPLTIRAVGVEAGITGPATVEELMNPDVISLSPDMLIRDAVKLFLEHRISSAPVLDPENRLLGVLSESDIMWKEVGVPDDHWVIQPTLVGFADLVFAFRDNKKVKADLQKVLARTVGEAMTKDAVVVSPSVTAQEAASTMIHKKVTQLPVIENGKVVGYLTRSDILRGMVLNDEL
eukprot:jgi/Botrbrau1/15292/Bobra.0371s0002.1